MAFPGTPKPSTSAGGAVAAILLPCLALLWTLLVTPDAAQGAVDPRKVDGIQITLSDWLNLRRDDRQVFMEGFAIGWHGTEASEATQDFSGAREDFDKLDLAIVKLSNQATRRHLLVGTVLVRAQLVDRLPLASHTARTWRALAVRHRLLLLHGIRAGIYGRSAWERTGETSDSRAIDEALWSLRSAPPPAMAFDPLRMLSDLNAHIERLIHELVVERGKAHALESGSEGVNGETVSTATGEDPEMVPRTPLIEGIAAVLANRIR